VKTYVDTSTWFGTFDTSIAVGSGSAAHICYEVFLDQDWTRACLRYATDASGDWQVKTIDDAGKVGQCCSIDLDSQGNVHICYLDRANNDLKYATNASGSWVVSTIDDAGGWYCSLALDTNDGIHISYHASGHLMYATKK
jgi:hypothetical protein